MKLFKWLIGIIITIGGFVAMAMGSSKRVKKLKKELRRV